jgi:hypothetical protein
MTAPSANGGVSRQARFARTALGMAARHPEQVTGKPARAEWRQLAAWLAELWPHDEYTAIVTGTRRTYQPRPIQKPGSPP